MSDRYLTESEAAVLAAEEDAEALDAYWARAFAAGRKVECEHGTVHWERSWIEDREVFREDLPEPTYSPGSAA